MRFLTVKQIGNEPVCSPFERTKEVVPVETTNIDGLKFPAKCTTEGFDPKILANSGDIEPGRASSWQVGNSFFLGIDPNNS